MQSIFPKPILTLSQAEVNLDGAKLYLVNGENEQVVFMEFEKDVEIPQHSHDSQWEIVLEGKVDYFEDGIKYTFKKGDRFFIPKGKLHSAKVYAGYSSIAFFNQKERYKKKQ